MLATREEEREEEPRSDVFSNIFAGLTFPDAPKNTFIPQQQVRERPGEVGVFDVMLKILIIVLLCFKEEQAGAVILGHQHDRIT